MYKTDDLTNAAHQGEMTVILRAAVRMLGRQTVYDSLPQPLHIYIFDHRGGCQIDIYFYQQGKPIITAWQGSIVCSASSHSNSHVLGLAPQCLFARPIIQSFFEQMYSAVASAFTYTSLGRRREGKFYKSDQETLEYYKSLF